MVRKIIVMLKKFQNLLERYLIPIPQSDSQPSLRKWDSSARLLLLSIVAGAIVEVIIMIALTSMQALPDSLLVLIDVLMTVIVVFPIIFFFLVRPLNLNIIERRKVEKQLLENQEYYRAIVEDQTEFIIRFTPDGKITFANQASCRYFQVDPDTVLGDEIYKAFSISDSQTFKTIQDTLTISEPVTGAYMQRYNPNPATLRWISWTIRALYDANQKVYQYQGVGRDITERYIIQNELQKAYNELEIRVRERTQELSDTLKRIRLMSTAVSSAANGIIVTDRNGMIEWINPAVTQITGYSSEELINQTPSILKSGKLTNELYEELWETISSGKVWRGELINRRKDDSLYFVEQTITPLVDDEGSVTHFIAIIQDISERQRVEQEVKARTMELQALHAINTACSRSLDSVEIISTLARLLGDEIGVPGGAVYLYDEVDDMLCPVSSWGLPEEEPALFKCVQVNDFHALKAIREKEVVLEDDFRNIERLKYASICDERPNWSGYLCVPLLAHDRVQGVLDLFKNGSQGILDQYDDYQRGFTQREVRFYQVLGNEIGVAVQNAKLYHTEQQARQMAESLQATSLALTQTLNLNDVIETLLNRLEDLIPYDSATVILRQDEDNYVCRASRGYYDCNDNPSIANLNIQTSDFPAIKRMILSGESLLIDDIRQDSDWSWVPGSTKVRNWLGVPVIAGGQVIGFYTIEKNEPGFYTRQDARLAEAIVGQVAVAVQNAWLFNQLRSSHESMQIMSRRLVEIQETERSYIARELHDEAGQALTSLMLGLDLMSKNAGNPETVKSGVKQLEEIVDEVLDNLHRMAMSLRPASLDHLGLTAALGQYVQAISEKHNLKVQFETVGIYERLPQEMETTIYRIIQEAVSNAIRHAHASRIDVLLEKRDGKVLALIEDNGMGFNREEAFASGRMGLFGMRERAEMLGGRLVIESSPGSGTTIQAEIPYLADEEIEVGMVLTGGEL